LPGLQEVDHGINEQHDTEPAQRSEELMHFFITLKKEALYDELLYHIMNEYV
jgi:hypothetical protein